MNTIKTITENDLNKAISKAVNVQGKINIHYTRQRIRAYHDTIRNEIEHTKSRTNGKITKLVYTEQRNLGTRKWCDFYTAVDYLNCEIARETEKTIFIRQGCYDVPISKKRILCFIKEN